jgi:hypothetical protein
MSVRRAVAVLVSGLVLVLGRNPGAEAQPAVVEKIDALNTSALSAYDAGDNQRAKNLLLEAVMLAKENGLDSHGAVARTYVNLGLIHVEGLKDEEKGIRYFVLALRIQPDIKLSANLATRSVNRVFALARGQASGQRSKDAEREAAPAEAETLKEREVRQRLQREKADLEEQLTEARNREQRDREAKQQLMQEKAELEKRLAEAKADVQRRLAEAAEREKQQRTEKEQILKQKQESEAQLAKQLAETGDREKKERETREKLEQERQQVEARASQQRQLQEKEKLLREKLAEGPDMPASIPQPLYCATQDEAEIGADLYVHCAPQNHLKAATAALFYRPSGSLHFNSLSMQRNRKGWFVATIPGDRVAGKIMQFYVLAQSKNGDTLASNGKQNLPNVILLKKPVVRPGETANLGR